MNQILQQIQGGMFQVVGSGCGGTAGVGAAAAAAAVAGGVDPSLPPFEVFLRCGCDSGWVDDSRCCCCCCCESFPQSRFNPYAPSHVIGDLTFLWQQTTGQIAGWIVLLYHRYSPIEGRLKGWIGCLRNSEQPKGESPLAAEDGAGSGGSRGAGGSDGGPSKTPHPSCGCALKEVEFGSGEQKAATHPRRIGGGRRGEGWLGCPKSPEWRHQERGGMGSNPERFRISSGTSHRTNNPLRSSWSKALHENPRPCDDV